jgi:hypothetical protein
MHIHTQHTQIERKKGKKGEIGDIYKPRNARDGQQTSHQKVGEAQGTTVP